MTTEQVPLAEQIAVIQRLNKALAAARLDNKTKAARIAAVSGWRLSPSVSHADYYERIARLTADLEDTNPMTTEQDERRLAEIREFVSPADTVTDRVFLLQIIDQARADLAAANERIVKQAGEIAELESGYQNCAELALTYHGEAERANERIARLEGALRRIANINNGPDKASGEWRCQEAAAIAEAALSPAGTVTPPENKDLAEGRC